VIRPCPLPNPPLGVPRPRYHGVAEMTKQNADTRGQDEEAEQTLWELVPVPEYRLPQTPVASAARARWALLKRLFGKRHDDDQTPVRAEADLRGLPEKRLQSLLGAVDWEPAADALQRSLDDRATADPVSLLIGPPRSGYVEVLRCWATRQGARWIEPPAYHDILEAGEAWLAGWPSDARCWLLPRLEHCWLRHPAGLALVRELLDRALAGRLGHGVIGCDSWAWAYLRYVAPLPGRSPLALQAFDGERLAALFHGLVAAHGAGPVRFRNAESGKLVFAVDGDDEGGGTAELQYLAARCRGNAGLAREVWRARLRAEPETDDGAAGDDAKPAGDDDAATIWVAAPAEEPPLAADVDEELALVLHALLQHNGLPGALLTELLPLPKFRVQAILHRLAGAGVVASAESGHWYVTAAGYAAARDLLKAQGFLLDDF